MSNVWILVIQLAAFLFCANNATEDFNVEHLNVLNEVHKVMKHDLHEKYCQVTREMHLLTTKFIVEFCGVQENENTFVCDDGRVVKQYNAIKAIKEHIEFATVAWDHEDPMILNAYNKIRTIYCDKIIEAGYNDEDDESRIDLSELYGVLKKEITKVLHSFNKVGEYLINRGQKLIFRNLVHFTGPNCQGAECKICITFNIPDRNEICIKMSYSTENGKLLVSLTHNKVETKQLISLDELAKCVKILGFLGSICIEVITGKDTQHNSRSHLNFCVGFLADKVGVGLKMCATYENGVLTTKFTPRLFPGARSENDDNILELHDNGKNGVQLDANEFNN